MDESGTRLEVSVSFGRFENDALSWEKWSSFSPNKYLEEVGSLSTPGSVAQKKAYFEAHYKKIAARKAEDLDQEHAVSPGPDMLRNEELNSMPFSNERLVGEVLEEACLTALANTVIADEEKDNTARSSKEDEHIGCINGVVDSVGSENGMSASVAVESQSSAAQEATGATDVDVDNPLLNVSKDAPLVVLEVPGKDSNLILKEPPEVRNVFKQSSVLRKDSSKLNSRNMAQKVTPINKERNLSGTRKKVVSSPTKPVPALAARHAKPTTISSPTSAPLSLKKANNSAPLKSKNSQVVQSKRVAPTSLHMSLSIGPGPGPADSLGDLPMTRKSLIMERMGDKDIVKRAFKTFQNRTNGFASDEKSTAVKQLSASSYEPKTSSYHTPTKGNEGLRKDTEKRTTQRSQSGTKSNPPSSGLRKSTALDKKNPMTPSPATGLRSDEKVEKRREFLKKLGAKSVAREHGAKSKVGVDNEIRPTLSR